MAQEDHMSDIEQANAKFADACRTVLEACKTITEDTDDPRMAAVSEEIVEGFRQLSEFSTVSGTLEEMQELNRQMDRVKDAMSGFLNGELSCIGRLH